MCCRKKITKPHSVEILEMLATRRAVQFIVELSFVHSVFEVDSEVVIKSLVDDNSSLTSIGHHVKDVMSISGLLQTYSFSHVRRQGNVVVHALAQ